MEGRIVRALAAGSLLFLTAGAEKPAEPVRTVNLLERPCDVPGETVVGYSRNILRAAQAAQARGQSNIGESLMPCPLASMHDAIGQGLAEVLTGPMDESTLARQQVVDILLLSREQVMRRQEQVAEGAI